MKIGIMAAMTEEIDSLFDELESPQKTTVGLRTYWEGKLFGIAVVVVFSRWGKVAASSTVTHLIDAYGVSEIIFTGVAGAIDPRLKAGDVVIASELVQHDLDASPIFGRYEIPLLGIARMKTDHLRTQELEEATRSFFKNDFDTVISQQHRNDFDLHSPKIYKGLIASGDSFFSTRAQVEALRAAFLDVLCVEMEGAAVAQVCSEYKIPFSIIRTISDSADEGATVDFQKFISSVASHYSHSILKKAILLKRA